MKEVAGRDAAFRLAAWKAWNERCAWCHNPLDFADLEIDHLIPKSLKGSDRKQALDTHGLPYDYDLDSTDNLAPAHGHPCNSAKAGKPLPDSPRIALLRDEAARLAPEIERAAARHRKARRLQEAVAVIDAADPNNLTPRQRENVVRASSIIAARLGVGTTARVHRAVDAHDYVAPDVRDVGLIFGMERFLELLREWADHEDLDDVVAESFDDAGQQELLSAEPRELLRLGYADDVDMFLARVQVDVNYTHYDDEGFGSEADADWTIDLWVTLDDSRSEVLEVLFDHLGGFPD